MSDSPFGNMPPELLQALLDNPHESQIVIDAQGIVRYISTADEAFFNVPRNDAIGKHISQLNPDSELPRVLLTGRAEIGRVFRLGTSRRIISRIPLRDMLGRLESPPRIPARRHTQGTAATNGGRPVPGV